MASCVTEMIWLKLFLTDLGLQTCLPMKLYCDNKAAINIANNPVQHDRTKHIEIDRHFIREKLDAGEICLPYIKSQDQIADIFTKGQTVALFQKCLSKLSMFDIYTQLEGECCRRQP